MLQFPENLTTRSIAQAIEKLKYICNNNKTLRFVFLSLSLSLLKFPFWNNVIILITESRTEA